MNDAKKLFWFLFKVSMLFIVIFTVMLINEEYFKKVKHKPYENSDICMVIDSLPYTYIVQPNCFIDNNPDSIEAFILNKKGALECSLDILSNKHVAYIRGHNNQFTLILYEKRELDKFQIFSGYVLSSQIKKVDKKEVNYNKHLELVD